MRKLLASLRSEGLSGLRLGNHTDLALLGRTARQISTFCGQFRAHSLPVQPNFRHWSYCVRCHHHSAYHPYGGGPCWLCSTMRHQHGTPGLRPRVCPPTPLPEVTVNPNVKAIGVVLFAVLLALAVLYGTGLLIAWSLTP